MNLFIFLRSWFIRRHWMNGKHWQCAVSPARFVAESR